MKRRSESRYITIPYQGIEAEQSGEDLRGEQVAAFAASISAQTSAHVAYSLDLIAEEFKKPIVLVVGYGDKAGKTARACRDAGLTTFVTYTRDKHHDSYIKIANGGVEIAEQFSDEIYENSYAILSAADECGAKAVLLLNAALADDRSFQNHAANRSLKVFKALDPEIPTSAWLISPAHKTNTEEAWRTCSECGLFFDEPGIAFNHYVCPSCGHYFRMSSLERINDILDAGSFEEWNEGIKPVDPLDFPGYLNKVEKLQESTGLDEAVKCGIGSIAGISLALCIMDSGFMMGSMGSIVGEKITRTIEKASEQNLPLLIFTASGGARMQEGLLSLMQMAKISSALAHHSEKGLFYISILTDPTTGGVTASFAMQGDIILAEPKALIGFAGKRVIRDTTKHELPDGFQTAEFTLEHGLIDGIVERKELRSRIAHLLALHTKPQAGQFFDEQSLISYASVNESLTREKGTNNTLSYSMFPQIKRVFLSTAKKMRTKNGRTAKTRSQSQRQLQKQTKSNEKLEGLLNNPYLGAEIASVDGLEGASSELISQQDSNQAWDSVLLARNTKRPTSQYYLNACIDGFIELHGDRGFGDDGALICGVGWLGMQPVTVIAQEKGADLKERVARNFGCAQPEGYRKSQRLMKQAEKFGRPIICFVDTQGAFCDMGAEERGQGNAIAENLLMLSSIEVPVISVIIGEGGSGGALALALADRVAMQRHAFYSVLSPEGFASILWKDSSRAPEAAQVMKLSAEEAQGMGVIDEVLSEGEGAAHENPEDAARYVKDYIVRTLDELLEFPIEHLRQERYERYRRF